MSRIVIISVLMGAFALSACTSSPQSVATPVATVPATMPAATVAPTALPSTASVAPPTITLTGQPTTTAPTTSVPPGTPAASFPTGSMIVTFDVTGEKYRVLLTDPDRIAIARQLLAGDEAPSIPNGVVVRGDASVNTGWNWHIDPDSLEFADMTTEVCDGKPSFVEQGMITGDRFCPWSAKVVAVEPANP